MRIRYADGSLADCMIIRLAGRRLRAAVAGAQDTIEFRLLLEDWVSENGEVVWFELATGECQFVQLCSDAAPAISQECAAGGMCMLRRIAGPALDGPSN